MEPKTYDLIDDTTTLDAICDLRDDTTTLDSSFVDSEFEGTSRRVVL